MHARTNPRQPPSTTTHARTHTPYNYAQQAIDDLAWDLKAQRRKRLGVGAPLRPTKENAWRLEQIYEDD